MNEVVCKKDKDEEEFKSDEETWGLAPLRAAIRAWWIAEYSGWYLDANYDGIDVDKEDEDRAKQFLEALKQGAFDFMLSVAADCQAPDWQDPARYGMRNWLPRVSPPMALEPLPFHDFFRKSLMIQYEVFVDAAISNIPDILRKLRTEEDEQRQLGQNHDQDLNLERFLIIISYAYEGRPDAAISFWDDPDSNLAGFLSWTSKRASTPLVSAFCEMLQCLSENEECATAAHNFLLDDGVHASGKLRRSQSLTWMAIWDELAFFNNKLREKASAAQTTTTYRAGKLTEQAETEPESAMMLECYLRLMAKLASQSEGARTYLLGLETERTMNVLLQLACNDIQPRLRACVFCFFKALLTNKTVELGDDFWDSHDAWMNGQYALDPKIRGAKNQNNSGLMASVFNEISLGFEVPNAVIQFLNALVAPEAGADDLHDSLPFPENLGAKHRSRPGIDPYVDYVLGNVFAAKSKDLSDVNQQRVLHVSCLEFALTCLATFNEDLIVLGNESNVAIDDAIATTDLITYVRLHPFARVMEWMFNDGVLKVIFKILHQDRVEVGNAPHDSPLITGIYLAVEVLLKVFDLQATYFDLIRPAIKMHSDSREKSIANAAYASIEDGLLNHLDLVVDLGHWCEVGYPPLTLACLKMLEKISTSTKIISAWNPGSGRVGNRNKAIVALEKNGEADAVATSLCAELAATLDGVLESTADNYRIKTFILDFLYECLRASPDRPTIAHLLLGFRCEMDSLAIDPRGAFDAQSSLFHGLLNIFLDVPYADEEKGMRQWLIALKYKVLRILKVLWNSSLSSALVMQELRDTKFLFHALLHGVSIGPQLRWEGENATMPEFLLSDASVAYIEFIAIRALLFEYMGKELCSVSQSRQPAVQRRIFDALTGQITMDEGSTSRVSGVFDLYDFLLAVEDPGAPLITHLIDLDLGPCIEEDPNVGVLYDLKMVKEVLALKRNEARGTNQLVSERDVAAMEAEEILLLQYLAFDNQRRLLESCRVKVLTSWTDLVLIMFHSGELKGNTKVNFLLQALQTILPSLESLSLNNTEEASKLAKLAKVLLFELNLGQGPESGHERALGALFSDKLSQLFQICIDAISKIAGGPDLRAVYYAICYRYLTAIIAPNADEDSPDRQRAVKTIRLHGERFLNIVCDDAYGSDLDCQTAAMVLLCALVQVSRNDDSAQVIETLNKLNFIAVLVDSLKTLHADWLAGLGASDMLPRTKSHSRFGALPNASFTNRPSCPSSSEQYINAKLALLLQLCQTRPGAVFVVQANLFHAVELSGAFAADPELEVAPADAAGLERHYALLAALARVVAAAVVARGEHSVPHGRRFLAAHRLLVVHALKRSVGIGAVGAAAGGERPDGSNAGASVLAARAAVEAGREEVVRRLERRVQDLAEAFMVLITATDFLEVSGTHPVFSPATD